MSKDEVTLGVTVDVDTGNLQDALSLAEEVADKELLARREVERTARTAASVANSMIGLFRNILSIVGVSLDAFTQALLQSIQQVIELAVAWTALQTAMAAGTFGLQAVGAGIAAAALGLVIGQAAHIAMYGDESRSKMNAALGALSNLEGIVGGLGRL